MAEQATEKTLSCAHVSIQHFPNKPRPLSALTHAHCTLTFRPRTYIRESVDSLCRDGADLMEKIAVCPISVFNVSGVL